MIYGIFENRDRYERELRAKIWREAFEKLATLTRESPLGIIPLRGNQAYINVHTYETKARAECVFEAHRNTIDLQFVIAGGEFVDLASLSQLRPLGPYDTEKDRQNYKAISKPISTLTLKPGFWAIFFPEDGHRPMICDGENKTVLKAVVKIDITLLDEES